MYIYNPNYNSALNYDPKYIFLIYDFFFIEKHRTKNYYDARKINKFIDKKKINIFFLLKIGSVKYQIQENLIFCHRDKKEIT